MPLNVIAKFTHVLILWRGVYDLSKQRWMTLPQSHIEISGPRCGAQSKQNRYRKKNTDLEVDVEVSNEDRHSTGDDFHSYMRHLDTSKAQNRHSKIFVTENVVGYQQERDSDLSDSETAATSFYHTHAEQFGARGFSGTYRILNGLDYASQQRRARFFAIDIEKSERADLSCCTAQFARNC